MKIYKFTRRYQKLANEFYCGNSVIDKFLKDGSALDENQGITYIMLSDENDFIMGYYNIEVSRGDRIEIVGNIKNIVPMGGAVNINYLAIHSDLQHTKIAEIDGQKIYFGDYICMTVSKEF